MIRLEENIDKCTQCNSDTELKILTKTGRLKKCTSCSARYIIRRKPSGTK